MEVNAKKFLGLLLLMMDLLAFVYMVATYGGIFLTAVAVLCLITEAMALFMGAEVLANGFTAGLSFLGYMVSAIMVFAMVVRALLYFLPAGIWLFVFAVLMTGAYATIRATVVNE